MPMMLPDAVPQRKRKCLRFLAASFALHALLLGLGELDFWQGPKMGVYPCEHTISVDLVVSGLPKEEAKGKGGDAPSPEPVTVNEVEKPNPAIPQSRKVERKKQAAPTQRKTVPKEEPSTVQDSPTGNMVMPSGKESSPQSGASIERSIGDVGAPAFAHFVPPEYPHQARARNREGRVLLRVLVSAEGRAREIQVVESSHPAFTRAARKSAQSSRYVPLVRQGRAEEVWVLIPFQFSLK